MGYGLRSVSGYFADKSHRHWAFAFLGYTVNMLAVPALALATRWPLAATLVVAERAGRGIRKPTVEAMLSYAGKSIGAGWVFGLNEALDQAGATIGPLLMALILYLNGGFRTGFGVLLFPALLCLAILVAARLRAPASTRTGGRRRPHVCDDEFDPRLLDLSRGRLTDRRWLRRLRVNRFPLSQGPHGSGKSHSGVLCGCNGEQRSRIDPTGPAV